MRQNNRFSPREEVKQDGPGKANQPALQDEASGQEDASDNERGKYQQRLKKLVNRMDDSEESGDLSDENGNRVGYHDDDDDRSGMKGAHDGNEANSKNKQCRDTLSNFKNLDIKPKGLQQSSKSTSNQKISNMSQADRDNTKLMVEAIAMQGEKKQEEKQKIEDSGWDLKFQKHVDYVINAQNDMNRNFLLSQRLLDHVGKFRQKATEEVVKIVDRLD